MLLVMAALAKAVKGGWPLADRPRVRATSRRAHRKQAMLCSPFRALSCAKRACSTPNFLVASVSCTTPCAGSPLRELLSCAHAV